MLRLRHRYPLHRIQNGKLTLGIAGAEKTLPIDRETRKGGLIVRDGKTRATLRVDGEFATVKALS